MGKRTAFTGGTMTIGHPHGKNKPWTFPHPIHKYECKMDRSRELRPGFFPSPTLGWDSSPDRISVAAWWETLKLRTHKAGPRFLTCRNCEIASVLFSATKFVVIHFAAIDSRYTQAHHFLFCFLYFLSKKGQIWLLLSYFSNIPLALQIIYVLVTSNNCNPLSSSYFYLFTYLLFFLEIGCVGE